MKKYCIIQQWKKGEVCNDVEILIKFYLLIFFPCRLHFTLVSDTRDELKSECADIIKKFWIKWMRIMRH